MTKNEALKLALEALERALSDDRPYIVQCKEAITAIREALAQPEQEPVGKFAKFSDGLWKEVTEGSAGVLLYTTPPQRKPLTDEEIMDNWLKVMWAVGDRNKLPIPEFARAIEAAHGIKE